MSDSIGKLKLYIVYKFGLNTIYGIYNGGIIV